MKFLIGGFTAVILAGLLSSQTAVASASCESLASLSLKDATITAASTVAAGAFRPPAGGGGGGAEEFKSLASFCRVAATLKPSPDSDIKVEVTFIRVERKVSAGQRWLGGTITWAMGRALRYATSSTDTGHTGGSVSRSAS
jgi:feruloyl esterase